ncbi:heterokaryon incompatibility protein-domain-containing protein [Xylariaceae sp. FL1651]|nr:heterokaryon incompatibility protein-domain-containing protein [Xylariaceae sp. FL1651]
MSALTNEFHYQGRLQGRQIRLLEILPCKLTSIGDTSTLEIRLFRQILDYASFHALSYVWRDLGGKCSVMCNGRPLTIGNTLREVLRKYRRGEVGALLWADAICINQEDDAEKTQQARMMREIYSRTTRTIIWLGLSRQYDFAGIAMLSNLYVRCSGAKYDASTHAPPPFDHVALDMPDPERSPIWESLFEILWHPWFTRVCIVQKLLGSKEPVMWRGELEVNAEQVLWLAQQTKIYDNLRQSLHIVKHTSRLSGQWAYQVSAQYFLHRQHGLLALSERLILNSAVEATDPRDRYFALAGISHNVHHGFVDYRRSLKEMACEVGLITLFSRGPGGFNGLDWLAMSDAGADAEASTPGKFGNAS